MPNSQLFVYLLLVECYHLKLMPCIFSQKLAIFHCMQKILGEVVDNGHVAIV